MLIRPAIETDIKAWSDMRNELWPATGDVHIEEIQAYFSGTSIDIRQAYIAEFESTIIGFMELNIRNFAEGSQNPEVPYIEAWYIDPKYQGKGFGKQLILKAEEWATSLGYTELASDTEIDNKKSISIHERLGFRETDRVVCFLKNLKNE